MYSFCYLDVALLIWIAIFKTIIATVLYRKVLLLSTKDKCGPDRILRLSQFPLPFGQRWETISARLQIPHSPRQRADNIRIFWATQTGIFCFLLGQWSETTFAPFSDSTERLLLPPSRTAQRDNFCHLPGQCRETTSAPFLDSTVRQLRPPSQTAQRDNFCHFLGQRRETTSTTFSDSTGSQLLPPSRAAQGDNFCHLLGQRRETTEETTQDDKVYCNTVFASS